MARTMSMPHRARAIPRAAVTRSISTRHQSIDCGESWQWTLEEQCVGRCLKPSKPHGVFLTGGLEEEMAGQGAGRLRARGNSSQYSHKSQEPSSCPHSAKCLVRVDSSRGHDHGGPACSVTADFGTIRFIGSRSGCMLCHRAGPVKSSREEPASTCPQPVDIADLQVYGSRWNSRQFLASSVRAWLIAPGETPTCKATS